MRFAQVPVGILALLLTAAAPAGASDAPPNQDPHYPSAVQALQEKRLSEAMSLFAALRKRYPKDPDLALYWAQTLHRLDHDRRFEAARQAVDLAPDRPDSLYLLIAVELERAPQSELEHWLAQLGQMVQSSENTRHKNLFRSAENMLADRRQRARKEVMRRVHEALARGQAAEARAAFAPLAPRADEDPELRYTAALIDHEDGRFAAALRRLRGLSATLNVEARYLRALCLEATGDDDGAERDYGRLVGGDDTELAETARQALIQIEQRRWDALPLTIEMNGGYDSDPSIISWGGLAEKQLPTEETGRARGELRVSGAWTLLRRGPHSLRWQLGAQIARSGVADRQRRSGEGIDLLCAERCRDSADEARDTCLQSGGDPIECRQRAAGAEEQCVEELCRDTEALTCRDDRDCDEGPCIDGRCETSDGGPDHTEAARLTAFALRAPLSYRGRLAGRPLRLQFEPSVQSFNDRLLWLAGELKGEWTQPINERFAIIVAPSFARRHAPRPDDQYLNQTRAGSLLGLRTKQHLLGGRALLEVGLYGGIQADRTIDLPLADGWIQRSNASAGSAGAELAVDWRHRRGTRLQLRATWHEHHFESPDAVLADSHNATPLWSAERVDEEQRIAAWLSWPLSRQLAISLRGDWLRNESSIGQRSNDLLDRNVSHTAIRAGISWRPGRP